MTTKKEEMILHFFRLLRKAIIINYVVECDKQIIKTLGYNYSVALVR